MKHRILMCLLIFLFFSVWASRNGSQWNRGYISKIEKIQSSIHCRFNYLYVPTRSSIYDQGNYWLHFVIGLQQTQDLYKINMNVSTQRQTAENLKKKFYFVSKMPQLCLSCPIRLYSKIVVINKLNLNCISIFFSVFGK